MTTTPDPNEVDRLIAEDIAANTDDEIEVGCTPATLPPVVASTTVTCSRCGGLVWVSNRILAALPERGKLTCLPCIARNPAPLN